MLTDRVRRADLLPLELLLQNGHSEVTDRSPVVIEDTAISCSQQVLTHGS